jgi:NAD(P)-dependent dehydrogenase (short-subunit alcohol dehydrogenase family)
MRWINTPGGSGAACAAAYFAFMQRGLRNQVVLITGGSRGLGLLLAQEFARDGARVAICARDAEHLNRARDELARAGAEAVALPCDVSNRAEVEETVMSVYDRFGALDVLVNNASIIQVGPLEDMTVDDFERAMAVNFWGGLYMALAAIPLMKQKRRGRIVNITSIGGKVAVPHLMPYDCAKFAAVGFSEGLRTELRRYGIRVTTVVPGLMRTGSALNAEFKGKAAEELAWFGAGDSLMFTSMNARRAARRIVRATERGQAYVTLSWQAKLLRVAHDVFPTVTARVLAGVNRVLPRSPGLPGPGHRGREVIQKLPQALRRTLHRVAEEANQ